MGLLVRQLQDIAQPGMRVILAAEIRKPGVRHELSFAYLALMTMVSLLFVRNVYRLLEFSTGGFTDGPFEGVETWFDCCECSLLSFLRLLMLLYAVADIFVDRSGDLHSRPDAHVPGAGSGSRYDFTTSWQSVYNTSHWRGLPESCLRPPAAGLPMVETGADVMDADQPGDDAYGSHGEPANNNYNPAVEETEADNPNGTTPSPVDGRV
jgi:hypothetical protein